MSLRAVLFDLDDTLYDHRHAIRAALREVAGAERALGTIDFEQLLDRYGEVLEELHPQVVAGRLTFDQARRERWRRLLQWAGGAESNAEALAALQWDAYLRNERLVPGAAELLDALRARQLPLGIVSNSRRAEQVAKLERLGVAAHFDAIVVAADHGASKPDPALFGVALRQLGVAASDAVFVGDRWDADIVGAHRAGMRAVWFNRDGRTPAAADVRQIEDFDDLDATLRALLGH